MVMACLLRWLVGMGAGTLGLAMIAPAGASAHAPAAAPAAGDVPVASASATGTSAAVTSAAGTSAADAGAAGAGAERMPEEGTKARTPGQAVSCANAVVRPLLGGGGWHRVQYELEDAYCGGDAGRLHEAILRPGTRQVTENHYAGALFTDLLARGDAAPARAWLRRQLDDGQQGNEQGGGYTNYYRADVLAGLRWAVEHDDPALRELAATWLRRSYALDALHVLPGGFEVALPCSRAKLYNRDGRAMALALLAGEEDPRGVLAARRWQYPAYDDVRWLADALLAGRLGVDRGLGAWALHRDRDALRTILAELAPLRLLSPLRWVLLDSGGWYSYAPGGIADAPSRPVDAVVVSADGTVAELVRPAGARRGDVLLDGARLVNASDRSIRGDGSVALPPGKPVISVEIGRGASESAPASPRAPRAPA
jgi:hypothetical protein